MQQTSLVRDLVWVVSGRVVGTLGLVAVTAMLSRSLTPDDYGQFFLIVSLVSVGVLIATFGQPQIVVRELSRTSGAGHRRVVLTVLAITCVAGTMLGLLLARFGDLISRWLDLAQLGSLSLLVAVWIIATAALRVAGEAARGMRMLRLASFFNGQAVTGSAATLVLLAALLAPAVVGGRLSLPAVLGAIVAAIGASLIFVLLALARYQAPREARASELPLGGYLLAGLPIVAGGLVSFATLQGDLWVVHATQETDRVAVYGAVRMLANLSLLPLAMVTAALMPRVASAYYEDRRSDLERLTRASTTVAVLLAGVLLVPALLVPELLLGRIFGEYYSGGATALRLLALAYGINVCSGAWGMLLLQTGYQKHFFVVTAFAAVVSLGLAFWFSRWWGLEGVAAGWLIGQSMLALVGLAVLRRRLGISALPMLDAARVVETIRARS